VANIFDDATAALDVALTQATGEAVTLTRGEKTSADVPARVSKVSQHVLDDGDLQVDVEVWDFLILTENYLIDGVPVQPARGDRITRTGKVYEVVPADGGIPAFSYCDPGRILMRVHTKPTGASGT